MNPVAQITAINAACNIMDPKKPGQKDYAAFKLCALMFIWIIKENAGTQGLLSYILSEIKPQNRIFS
jgi:hypothetical protein